MNYLVLEIATVYDCLLQAVKLAPLPPYSTLSHFEASYASCKFIYTHCIRKESSHCDWCDWFNPHSAFTSCHHFCWLFYECTFLNLQILIKHQLPYTAAWLQIFVGMLLVGCSYIALTSYHLTLAIRIKAWV